MTALALTVLAAAGARSSAPLSPAWVFPREGRLAPIASSPTVYHNTVYVGSDDGLLYALTATGPDAGRMVPGFPVTLDGAVKGRPAVYGDQGAERVYVATSAGSLYAFRLDGSPAWARTPQPLCPGVPIISTPAVRGEYVYVTATNGRVIRRRTFDGADAGGLTYGRVVQTGLAAAQRVPPLQTDLAVKDARAFFSTGRVTVLSPGPQGTTVTGEFTYAGKNTSARPNRLINVYPLGGGPAHTMLDARSVVVGYGPGASAGPSPVVPVQRDSTLVIAALDTDMSGSRAGLGRNMVALKSESYGLVPQWEATYGERITAAPTLDERVGSLFTGSWNNANDPSRGGRLYCINASNGQATWPGAGYLPLAGGVLKADPWLDRGRHILYFGTTDGSFYGVNTADGAPAFTPSRLDGQARSFEATPVVVGATAYIGSQSGRFYAINVENPADFSVYSDPDGGALTGSPSASGSVPGQDVVVVGSAAGRILAFPVR